MLFWLDEILFFNHKIGKITIKKNYWSNLLTEAMAVEEVIEVYWQLKGYWTKLRYSLEENNWTDIDVIAYNPKNNEIIICESKVRGKNRTVRPFTQKQRNKFNIYEIDLRTKKGEEESDYFSLVSKLNNDFLDNIIKKLNVPDKGIKFAIHFVCNYWIETDQLKEEAQKFLKDQIDNKLHEPYSIDRVTIDTTFDLLCEIIKLERENKQGKRYGNTIIDIAREINRYTHPQIEVVKGKKCSINKADRKKLKQDLIKYCLDKCKQALDEN